MCRKHRTNLRRKRTIVLFVSPLFYIRFFPDVSKDSSTTRALRVAKDLQRTRLSDLAGIQLARHVSEIDRSRPLLMMSRCNRRVTDTREEMLWETTRETRAIAGFIILKLCPFELQNHNSSVYGDGYVRRK